MLNTHVPAWFECRVLDRDYAQAFCACVPGVPLGRANFAGGAITVLADGGKPKARGALIASEERNRCLHGSIVSLSVADLSLALTCVYTGEDDTVVSKTALSERLVHLARFRDGEGDRVVLWLPA